MKNRILSIAIIWAAGVAAAIAHETGTSRFRLDIGEHAVESRFQIDLLTLLRLVPGLDRNRDNRIAREEAEAGAPAVAEYLAKRVTLDIDGKEAADWGVALPVIWPGEEGRPIAQADYHRLLVQFPFRRKVTKLPADVRVTFDVFIEFGGNHRVFGDIGAGEDARESVVFTHLEPDFLFDVDYVLTAK